jgi:hypothetical protein
MRCVTIWKSYPDESWDEFVKASKGTRQRKNEQKACAAHLDNVGILNSYVPWPDSKVQSQVFSGYTVKVPFDIYSEQEFRDRYNVSMEDVGLKCNHEITNQFGKPESVLLVRNKQPRQLEAHTFTGTLLDVARMSQRVREFQPEAQFAHEVNQELDACPYKPGSKRRLLTSSKVSKLVKKHVLALEQKEAAGDDGQESSEEEAEQEEPQFFRRNSGGKKANKAESKKKGKKPKGSAKAVAKGAAAGKKASALTSKGSTSAVGFGTGSNMQSGGAASVVSVGRVSVGSASVIAAEGNDGAGVAAASSRSTIAGGADKDAKGSTFYFDFQSIVDGTTDRNALNGAFDSSRSEAPLKLWNRL